MNDVDSTLTDKNYIRLDGNIIGYIEAEGNILRNIEINKDYRRQGHAEKALKTWIERKKGEHELLETTTVTSYEMERLLEKLDFEKKNKGDRHYLYYY